MKRFFIIIVIAFLSIILFRVFLSTEPTSDYAKRDLTNAACKGNITKLKLLLFLGLDVNAEAPGKGYALVCAATFGQTETVTFLLDNGADINVTNKFRTTALTSAVWDGHTETVRVLLARGANVNIVSGEGAALHIALKKNYGEITEMLKQHSAKNCNEYQFDKCF